MRAEEHKLFERLLLRRESKIGDLMDLPSVILKSRHRILFHTIPEIMLLSKFTSLLDGSDFWFNVKAGLLHLALDNLLSLSYKALNEEERKKIKEDRNGKKTSRPDFPR